jgi:hypothetical protein
MRVSAFILLTVSAVSAFQAPCSLGFGANRGLAISRRACSNRKCAASSLLMVSDAAAPLLTKAQEAKEATGASTKLIKALKKPTGAITVSIEYSSPDADMDTANSVDFRTLSAELRRGKNTLILCDGSTERGIADIKNFAKEQVYLPPPLLPNLFHVWTKSKSDFSRALRSSVLCLPCSLSTGHGQGQVSWTMSGGC